MNESLLPELESDISVTNDVLVDGGLDIIELFEIIELVEYRFIVEVYHELESIGRNIQVWRKEEEEKNQYEEKFKGCGPD